MKYRIHNTFNTFVQLLVF